MNQLQNIDILDSNIIKGSVTDVRISPQSISMQSYSALTIDDAATIDINGEIFTGLDLKEMLQLKDKLKQIYPEMFV